VPGEGSSKLTFFCVDTMVHICNVPSVFSASEQAPDWWKQAKLGTGKESQADRELTEETLSMKMNKYAASKGAPSFLENLAGAWRVKFYESISLRLGGIVFMRYRVRSTIKLTASLCFLWTGFLIRMTPASETLNTIIDHSIDMPTHFWVFGISFFLSDLFETFVITGFHLSNPKRKRFFLRRYGRILQDPAYLGMIVSCHVCCNSDVFLIFPTLKFCPT